MQLQELEDLFEDPIFLGTMLIDPVMLHRHTFSLESVIKMKKAYKNFPGYYDVTNPWTKEKFSFTNLMTNPFPENKIIKYFLEVIKDCPYILTGNKKEDNVAAESSINKDVVINLILWLIKSEKLNISVFTKTTMEIR